MRLGAWIAIATLALGAPRAGRAGNELVREVRPDGMELLVLPMPGAHTVSLRYVVRAGSALDPPDKLGMAHLLEHMVLRRRGPDGLDLMEAARAAGVTLNGFTSRDRTVFVLDAPAEAFPGIAERLLRAVTGPEFQEAEVDREIAVVGRESEYQDEDGGAIQLVSDALFRAGPPPGAILGTGVSRGQISPADLAAFYQARYSTSATSVVVAGGTTAEQVRSLLARAVLLPPVLEAERPAPASAEPILPVNERLRAPFITVALGYRLEEADRSGCRPLAELLERRLSLELILEQPQLDAISVHCLRLQGTDFVLAFGYTPTIDATEVPAAMQRVFREIATRPPTAQERRSIEQRMSRENDRTLADPSSLADHVAHAAAERRTEGGAALGDLGARVFPQAAVRELARKRFLPERKVLIILSPFEG